MATPSSVLIDPMTHQSGILTLSVPQFFPGKPTCLIPVLAPRQYHRPDRTCLLRLPPSSRAMRLFIGPNFRPSWNPDQLIHPALSTRREATRREERLTPQPRRTCSDMPRQMACSHAQDRRSNNPTPDFTPRSRFRESTTQSVVEMTPSYPDFTSIPHR